MKVASLVTLCLGMVFVYLGMTATASNEPFKLPDPSPTVLTDEQAGYDQAKYDECLDRADLSDEAQCED